MATYTYQMTANLNRLKAEIITAGLPAPVISSLGTTLSISFVNALSGADEATLSATVTAHNAVIAEDQIAPVILSAAEYGMKLIRDLGTRNMVLGKTDAQIDSILENSDTLKIGMALMSGSLKYARRKVTALTPFEGVTVADKDWLYDQLTLFLGPE